MDMIFGIVSSDRTIVTTPASGSRTPACRNTSVYRYGEQGFARGIPYYNSKSVDNKVVSYLSQMQKQDKDLRESNATIVQTYSTFWAMMAAMVSLSFNGISRYTIIFICISLNRLKSSPFARYVVSPHII